jgi:hypothetical protein
MSTDEIPPEIGFYFDAMSGPLADASAQYNTDDRFQTIATLLATISAEWTADPAQTSSDLDTLGQTLTEVQLSHPTDSNVASLEQLYLALQGVRSGLSSTPSASPMAVPAPAKLTVFDVAGTSVKSVLSFGLDHPTAQTPPSWNLANLANSNPTLITIKEVPYPACVPFNASYQAGAASLISMINNMTGPFAMVGTSQGAMVIASVYKRLLDPNDALHSRNGDFLQGITYGNPCRQPGSIAPGCADPGGWGINVDSWLQSNVEPRWWDFANPGDPAACNGAGKWNVGGIPYDYRGSIGNWSALMFSEMCRNAIGNFFALLPQLQNPPPTILGILPAVFETLIGASAGPHTTYDKTTPNGAQPGLTCTQLAAQQLLTVARSIP